MQSKQMEMCTELGYNGRSMLRSLFGDDLDKTLHEAVQKSKMSLITDKTAQTGMLNIAKGHEKKWRN